MSLTPRLFLPLLAGLVLAVPAQAQFRTVADDDWCRRHDSWNDDEDRYREAVLPASARISVEAEPNGGIKVVGTDRGDIRVRAKVSAGARSQDDARTLASEVRI